MSTGNLTGSASIGNRETRPTVSPPGAGFSGTSNHPTPGLIGRPGANAEAGCDGAPPDPAGGGFLSANGQRDSHAITLADGTANGSPRAGQPYGRISWDGIARLVARPAARTKDRAPLVILSTYVQHDGRTHAVQRAQGWFGGLAVDIDKGNSSLEDVVAAFRQAVGDVAALIYSSSSSEPENRKWRILIPLESPVAGEDYAETELALFELLQERGIVCDPALARAAQPVFLPNVPPKRRGPDGRPVFYQARTLTGRRLELVPGERVFDARAALRARRAEEESQAAARAEKYRQERAAKVAAGGDDFDPIEHFKANHTVGQLLAQYGFTQSPKHGGQHWRSPLSDSGSFSTQDRGDHWVTVSAWAHNHNVGRTSKNGNRYGDAFDLFCHFEHGGNRSAAVAAYAETVRPAKTGPKTAAVRVEPVERPAGELVPIDQYRRDIAQAIAEVVLEGRPGIKLLRAAPGTGKTYAVARAVAKYRRGITSVPGHELAAEVVETLRAAGANAAAYPRLDAKSCGNYDTAARAQSAGLSAPAAVCPNCPLLVQCRENGYLADVKAAEAADHRVVTHARLVRSAARLTEHAEYVVLEEDPSAALVPMLSATRRQLQRLAELADVWAESLERSLILDGADLVAVDPFEEFQAWAPEPVEVRQAPPADIGADVAATPGRRRFPRGFFGAVCRIADELAGAAGRALADELADGIHAVDVRPARDIPKNPEGTVWQALAAIDRVDPLATAGIGADTMRLVVAAATGRLERVVLQLETDTRPGARKRAAGVVGLWRTRLPVDRVPVFVNDGTSEPETLQRIAGVAVEDITPTGHVPFLHFAGQYPVDILPTTSTARVAAILTGLARHHADLPRLGVLMHQRHYRELIEAEDSPLPADIRERITWSTYFGSGADRGTNALHRVADVAIVLGTHRPPPSEVRRTLLRWGDIEAAGGKATWGRIDRQGQGQGGEVVPYHGRGYAEAPWAAAADAVIRAGVRQASARSRAIAPDGVAVVVVSTEATGLPVLDPASLPVARPRLEELLEALAGATGHGVKMGKSDSENRAKNPISLSRENCAILAPAGVTVEALEQRLPGVASRTVQLWLREAIDAGLVVRTGAARATRYRLAAEASAPVAALAPAPARAVPRPAASPPPAPVIKPPAPPARLVAVKVEPTRPMSPPVVEVQPRPVFRPAVVQERPPGPDWLADVLAPSSHPDELLAARFFMGGPYAEKLGKRAAWELEVCRPLVFKLQDVATLEAKRRGQPPPPIDVVAGHTVAWWSAVAQAG